MKKEDLILSFNRAFWGAISKDVRAITFNYVENRIKVFVYFDRLPTEKDYEVIDMAITEVMADFPEILSQEINLKESNGPLGTIKDGNNLFFLRYEDEE